MDHFGIGAALGGIVRAYMSASRQTGRTTSLVESLRPGDRVVCFNTPTAQHLRRRLRAHGLDESVDVVVVPTFQPEELLRLGTSTGRTLFDHTWIEEHYLDRLQDIARTIDTLQRETSGFGAAHIETRERAQQLADFNLPDRKA